MWAGEITLFHPCAPYFTQIPEQIFKLLSVWNSEEQCLFSAPKARKSPPQDGAVGLDGSLGVVGSHTPGLIHPHAVGQTRSRAPPRPIAEKQKEGSVRDAALEDQSLVEFVIYDEIVLSQPIRSPDPIAPILFPGISISPQVSDRTATSQELFEGIRKRWSEVSP